MTATPKVQTNDGIDAALGREVRNRRRRLKQPQQYIASATGINVNVLSRLERGERAWRVAELDAVAAALGVNATTLAAAVFG